MTFPFSCWLLVCRLSSTGWTVNCVCCLVITSSLSVIIPMLYHFAVGLVRTPTLIRIWVTIESQDNVVLGPWQAVRIILMVQPQLCCFTNLLGLVAPVLSYAPVFMFKPHKWYDNPNGPPFVSARRTFLQYFQHFVGRFSPVLLILSNMFQLFLPSLVGDLEHDFYFSI